MSGIALAETVFYQEDSASPLTVLKPAAAADGDVLVVGIAADTGPLSDITTPATWLDEGSAVDATNQKVKVFSHTVTGGDPASWDFPYNAAASMCGVLLRYTLADQTPVVVVASNSTGSNSSTLDSPSGTPSGGDDILVCLLTIYGHGTPLAYTAPSGLTDLGSIQIAGGFEALAAATMDLTSSSPTGAQTWSGISPTLQGASGWTILVKSSGVYDPDPPLKPPAPELPSWLLEELLAAKAQKFVGHHGTPVIKEMLSGGASGANVALTTSATTDTTDLLVLFHGNNFYAVSQLGPPTTGTWALRATGDDGTNSAHMKVFTSPAAGGAQTVTCPPAVDEEHTVHLFVVSGADLTNPVDGAAGGNGASSTSHIAPSVGPITSYPLLLAAAQSTTEGNYTLPTVRGLRKTSEVDVSPFTTGATGAEVLAGPGTTGTRTFTTSAAGAYATATVAIAALIGTVVSGGSTCTAADTASVTDAAVSAVSLIRTAADTASASDGASRVVAGSRTASDISSTSDTASAAVVRTRSAADTASATDSATRDAETFSRAAADTAAATDVATRVAPKVRTAADTAAATDIATSVAGPSRTAADTAAATDTATRSTPKARSTSDTAQAADAASRTAPKSRAASDNSSATDAATRVLVRSRTVSDTSSVTDAAGRQINRSRTLTDPATASDTAARTPQVFARTGSDTVAAADTATGLAVSINYRAGGLDYTTTATIIE